METIIDKAKELQTSLILVNDRLHFRGNVSGNSEISIDYIPPLGDNLGYTSLELLLLSLSSCLGSAVLLFLRRMKKEMSGFEIKSKGIRKEEHPTCFKKITMDVEIISSDITSDDFEKVLKIAEEKYCPVWAMLKGNVDIEVGHNIISQ